MASAWHGEEPELCTEPVTLECAVCGKAVQYEWVADEDEEEYVCLTCCTEAVRRHDAPK